MNVKNPFLIKGYVSRKYFCDREDETRRMASALENGRDVTLIAPRRYGKTGLIWNVFERLGSEYKALYMDIYNIRSLADFVKVFASTVTSELSTPLKRTGRGVLSFFKTIRPTIIPQQDGYPKFSFDLAPHQAEATLKEAFDFLKARKVEPVIAIDEVQQIREFPESGVEALLRSHIQFCHNAHFIFAGSRHHLMRDIFISSKGPFFQSTEIMSLGTIDIDRYFAFAAGFFREKHLPFERESFDYLYRRFDGVTWYVQMVLNRLWEFGEGLRASDEVEAAIGEIVDARSQEYHDLLASQPGREAELLSAIALDGVVAEPRSAEFLTRHGLGASSTVGSALARLCDKELVYRTEAGYIVYERFFSEWLKRCQALGSV